MPGEATSFNGQNPRLLACFDALSNAQAMADDDSRQAAMRGPQ